MHRTLRPELLDSLPPDHPDALHNRRDLRLTNAIIGTPRWLERTLRRVMRPGEVALEIGAGTGELGLRLAAANIAVDGLDLWPRPGKWPVERVWHRADLRTFDGYDRYPVIIANLILHQFPDTELAMLGQRLRRHVRVLVAAEPARRRVSQVLFRGIAPLLGANHVSLHDAHVSIGAGFQGDELPRLMGFNLHEWAVDRRTTTLGVYRLTAVRRE
ncbi:MAG: class I SAM-dependent methyltransferase [Opitutaceae bacterium]|nr:class I SAM-dependent methyltransferase [Opitutaceae bacterium]